jgi:hypothetical protein
MAREKELRHRGTKRHRHKGEESPSAMGSFNFLAGFMGSVIIGRSNTSGVFLVYRRVLWQY